MAWSMVFCNQVLFEHGDGVLEKEYPVIGLIEEGKILASSEKRSGPVVRL